MRRLLLLGLALLFGGCGPRTTDDFLGQLKAPDVVQRREAIRELGGRTAEAERVVPALAEALGDDNEYVRRDAATTLGKFGPAAQPAVPALVRALQDRQRGVRTAAAAALKKIDPAAAARAGIR